MSCDPLQWIMWCHVTSDPPTLDHVMSCDVMWPQTLLQWITWCHVTICSGSYDVVTLQKPNSVVNLEVFYWSCCVACYSSVSRGCTLSWREETLPCEQVQTNHFHWENPPWPRKDLPWCCLGLRKMLCGLFWWSGWLRRSTDKLSSREEDTVDPCGHDWWETAKDRGRNIET